MMCRTTRGVARGRNVRTLDVRRGGTVNPPVPETNPTRRAFRASGGWDSPVSSVDSVVSLESLANSYAARDSCREESISRNMNCGDPGVIS